MIRILIVALLATGSASAWSIFPRAKAACYAPEPAKQICYSTANGADPQGLDIADIKWLAGKIRYDGKETARLNSSETFYHMGGPEADNCAEWIVRGRDATLVLAKHNNGDQATAVLLEDIANTIDGGVDATEEQKKKSLLGGCGGDGGQMGVQLNKTNPLYKSPLFNSTWKMEGIIIKVARNLKYNPNED